MNSTGGSLAPLVDAFEAVFSIALQAWWLALLALAVAVVALLIAPRK